MDNYNAMKSPTTKDNNPVNDTNNANYKKTTTSDTWLSIKQRIGANPRPRATQRTEGGASQKITTGEKTTTKTGEHAIQKRHRNGVEHKSQLRLNQPLIRIEDTIQKKIPTQFQWFSITTRECVHVDLIYTPFHVLPLTTPNMLILQSH